MRTRYPCLAVLGLCLTPVFAEPSTGVSAARIARVDYSPSRASEAKLQRAIEARLATVLVGAGEARRVRFRYAGRSRSFGVKGALFSWENLRVERYRVRSARRALELANHEPERPGEPRGVEVQGREVLVASGAAASDPATLLALRQVCWPGDDEPAREEEAPGSLDGSNRGFTHDWVDFAVERLRQKGPWWQKKVKVPKPVAKLLRFPDSASTRGKDRAYLTGHLVFPFFLRSFLEQRCAAKKRARQRKPLKDSK